jgi:hypothetical protein
MDESRDSLQAAVETTDIDALRYAVAHASRRSAAPMLARLLVEDWHDSHEDIVLELGLIRDACAIETIEKVLAVPPAGIAKSGEWGNLHEFQRKCACALARIGTPES